jgi:acyl carrier protein
MTVGQPDDTRDRLIAILTSPTHMSLQLSALDINDETSLINDLGLDSIQLLEFTIAIEDEFKIEIAESVERSTLQRFADFVAFVRAARHAANVMSGSNT